MMPTIGPTLLGYLLGSIPVSILFGKLILHSDIRQFGSERNHGAVDARRAGKWNIGLPVLLLDFFKGVLPVYLALHPKAESYEATEPASLRAGPTAIRPGILAPCGPSQSTVRDKDMAPAWMWSIRLASR